MKPLRIDFATPGMARTFFQSGVAAALLVAATLGLCGWTGATAMALLAEQNARSSDARLAEQRAVREASRPAPVLAQIPEAQAQAVNAMVLQLNLPWRELHDAITAATPASIALLSIEPDARKRALNITGEAKNADDMVAYIALLKAQEMFVGVVLVRHEINEQDPNQPIRFDLAIQWRVP